MNYIMKYICLILGPISYYSGMNISVCRIAKISSIFYCCQADGHLSVYVLTFLINGKLIKHKNNLALTAFCFKEVLFDDNQDD